MKLPLEVPIVGNSFRPFHARALYRDFIRDPSGWRVTLKPEPENPHDENAIACYLDLSTSCSHCQGSGLDGFDISDAPCGTCSGKGEIEQSEHVGYIPRDSTAPIHEVWQRGGELFIQPVGPGSSRLLITEVEKK